MTKNRKKEVHSITEWARIYGIKPKLLQLAARRAGVEGVPDATNWTKQLTYAEFREAAKRTEIGKELIFDGKL